MPHRLSLSPHTCLLPLLYFTSNSLSTTAGTQSGSTYTPEYNIPLIRTDCFFSRLWFRSVPVRFFFSVSTNHAHFLPSARWLIRLETAPIRQTMFLFYFMGLPGCICVSWSACPVLCYTVVHGVNWAWKKCSFRLSLRCITCKTVKQFGWVPFCGGGAGWCPTIIIRVTGRRGLGRPRRDHMKFILSGGCTMGYMAVW